MNEKLLGEFQYLPRGGRTTGRGGRTGLRAVKTKEQKKSIKLLEIKHAILKLLKKKEPSF